MFHATIRSEEGRPLQLSGEASPYNLETLRDHLARHGAGTRVEIHLAAALQPALRRALRDVERRGVVLVVEP